ncbi:copper-binding protein [Paracidovorax sp. MALMAid1276]|uniref:copper-binding protein n=1 Tax=Paracidovorax sp. MALMAid1276 TaxID=3411631 RepID=UPI003B99A114
MKTKHLLFAVLAAGLSMPFAGLALAQAPAATAPITPAAAAPSPDGQTASAAPQAVDWSEGEITRWDPRTLRLTIRHGEIRNLDMPPMTMVFRVADASLVGDLQPGDKVRFRAEQASGAYHVRQIEKAR